MSELPFDIQVSSLCPEDRLLVVDPNEVVMKETWLSDVFDALERKIVICPDEETADRIREAAEQFMKGEL